MSKALRPHRTYTLYARNYWLDGMFGASRRELTGIPELIQVELRFKPAVPDSIIAKTSRGIPRIPATPRRQFPE